MVSSGSYKPVTLIFPSLIRSEILSASTLSPSSSTGSAAPAAPAAAASSATAASGSTLDGHASSGLIRLLVLGALDLTFGMLSADCGRCILSGIMLLVDGPDGAEFGLVSG